MMRDLGVFRALGRCSPTEPTSCVSEWNLTPRAQDVQIDQCNQSLLL